MNGSMYVFIYPSNHATLKIKETVLSRDDLNVEPFADIITKAAHSPQLFQDPECWFSLLLEPSTSSTADWRSTN